MATNGFKCYSYELASTLSKCCTGDGLKYTSLSGADFNKTDTFAPKVNSNLTVHTGNVGVCTFAVNSTLSDRYDNCMGKTTKGQVTCVLTTLPTSAATTHSTKWGALALVALLASTVVAL
ncbi:hypothetical protein Q8F55_007268 [Vanrija albida]|uniref:Uncharacterized protein n=1 Tax=Vanrija albida TaxID=181172 RepID=A0ABR3PZP6_9TREE